METVEALHNESQILPNSRGIIRLSTRSRTAFWGRMLQSFCLEGMSSPSNSIDFMLLIFFFLKSGKSLENISRHHCSVVSPFLDHQNDVSEWIVQGPKQSSHYHVWINILGAERFKLIGESSESAIDGIHFLSFMPLEPVEFPSQNINTSLFLSWFSFTNFLEILPDSFSRLNILDLMVLLRNQMICDKYPYLSVKSKVFLLSFHEVFLIHHNDTILHDIPGIQVDGDDWCLHTLLFL